MRGILFSHSHRPEGADLAPVPEDEECMREGGGVCACMYAVTCAQSKKHFCYVLVYSTHYNKITPVLQVHGHTARAKVQALADLQPLSAASRVSG